MMKVVYFKSQEEFRVWLSKAHAAAAELWLGFYKTSSGKRGTTYSEALDEALCFGWIDGVRYSVDGERYKIRFTPRKAKSIWSLVNVRRAEALTKAKKMTEAGLRSHWNLCVRTETAGPFGEIQKAAPRQSHCVGVFRAAGAVVPAHRRLLGEQRQAGRDACAAIGQTDRSFRGRSPVGSVDPQSQAQIGGLNLSGLWHRYSMTWKLACSFAFESSPAHTSNSSGSSTQALRVSLQ